jgi:hypothetical protein
MFELINSENLITNYQYLKFTLYEFENELNRKGENEFEFRGKMYDIVKIEKNDSTVLICCIWDRKEDELIADFEKYCEQKSSRDKFRASHSFSKTFNLIAIQNKIVSPYKLVRKMFLSTDYFINYRSVFKKILTPPPKLV